MGIEAELREEFDRWERKEIAVLKVLPYPLLAVSVLFTLVQPLWNAQVHLPATLGLATVLTAWVLWFHTLHPESHRNDPLMGLYYTGLVALTACLVLLTPWFGFFAFIGYVHAFQYLKGRWRYVGVAVTSAVAAVSYVGGSARITAEEWWKWPAVSAITMVLATAAFHADVMSHRRNDRQKRALVELHRANTELENALAENAGLHAQLLVQAREAGVLDERQRMAREIHDTLAQGLAGILTQLQAAEQASAEPVTSRRHVANAMELARESLAEARRTVHAVGPSALAEARLPDAIGDVARRWSEVNRVEAVLTTTGDARPMHTDVEVALLRTAQEALTNVAKHARAGRVALTLSYMEDLVTLDVLDDGVGFAPDAKRAGGSPDGGFGLAGMRQRVQRLAGRLDVESEPGGGTAITVTVPAIPAGSGS
ncbi:signal transduction histidine kinase [Saccharothrix saharensis]|uniref:Oxygen sensor histidine kinase NreB n=1 Tax=Saccharothrix saharensis TaxID=571190 RepID=A0A543JNZ9_9PSEU|nr:sensor histidine kinase [Saccharothrix saharensis]TQM84546.1 signal transduction histidine kinase [Saccharothrix saharensis]